MAGETLLTLSEVLASFPDNTQQLITPLNSRNMVVTEAVNVGYLDDNALPVTIPIVDGVPVVINPLLTAPEFVGNFWRIDANNSFTESYTTEGITVNPGTVRISAFRAVMLLEKVGAGSDTYIFEWLKNGTPIGQPAVLIVEDTDPFYVQITADDLTDMSLGDTFAVQVTGSGTGDDLNILQLLFRATGAPI